MSILNWQGSHQSSNFETFECSGENRSYRFPNRKCYFFFKFYTLSTKGAYQSTKSDGFHVSSQKSKILHFDELLWSKSYKVSAKKVQKSYISWHWRVMQRLKKNWLVVSNITWKIWWIFTQPLKCPKILLQWAIFCPKYMRFELKNTKELSFMILNSDAKFE